MRYVLMAFNVVLIAFGTGVLVQIFPYLTAGFALALAVLIYQSQKQYGEIDMDDARLLQTPKVRRKKVALEEQHA